MHTHKCASLLYSEYGCYQSSLHTLVFGKVQSQSDHRFARGTKQYRIAEAVQTLFSKFPVPKLPQYNSK